jgi:hypothetical protein
MRNSLGWNSSARATATSCRSPPESVPTSRVGSISAPSSASAFLRTRAHAPAVEEGQRPETALQLPPEEDVRGDVEVGAEGEVLVDHLDPGGARIEGASEGDRSIGEGDRPAGRPVDAGEDLDERRLTGPVVADEADRLGGADLQTNVTKRLDRSEALRDVSHLEKHGIYG